MAVRRHKSVKPRTVGKTKYRRHRKYNKHHKSNANQKGGFLGALLGGLGKNLLGGLASSIFGGSNQAALQQQESEGYYKTKWLPT